MAFPREQLADVLRAVGQLARNNGEETDVYLPEEKLTLPFTSRFRTVPVLVHDSVERIRFDTSLNFPVGDEVIESYVREQEQHMRKQETSKDWTMPRDAQNRVAVGYIYLNVQLKPELQHEASVVILSFDAATTGMSHLFEDSVSVRQTFLDFAKQQNALYLLLDRENDGVVWWLDGQEIEEVIADVYATDVHREVRFAAIARKVNENVGIEYSNVANARTYLLHSDDPEVRQIALRQLNDDAEDSFDALVQSLRDENADVRLTACTLLMRREEARAFDSLLPLVDDEEEDVRSKASAALYYTDKKRAIKPLLRQLEDASLSVRKAATLYLGHIGDKRATSALIEALQDSDAGVRKKAVQALGRINDKDAVVSLCQLCADEAGRISNSFGVWRDAFEALGQIGDGRAAGVLSHILIDQFGLITNSVVRADALRALEHIGDENAVKVLELLSKNKSNE
ncbi:MAG TPA: HEAT repeat domain-containing protein, partial [Abditibacteriaceae bacterium]|nr:HEAT repeat domain-containing protein [Abditibacteriaceae bacterium]